MAGMFNTGVVSTVNGLDITDNQSTSSDVQATFKVAIGHVIFRDYSIGSGAL